MKSFLRFFLGILGASYLFFNTCAFGSDAGFEGSSETPRPTRAELSARMALAKARSRHGSTATVLAAREMATRKAAALGSSALNAELATRRAAALFNASQSAKSAAPDVRRRAEAGLIVHLTQLGMTPEQAIKEVTHAGVSGVELSAGVKRAARRKAPEGK